MTAVQAKFVLSAARRYELQAMTPFDRQLQAAHGYLELGMPLEANDELEEIEPEMHALSQVLAIRSAIYQTLAKWKPMIVVCQRLCIMHDDDPQWPLMLAYATRRHVSTEDALSILADASNVFRDHPTILFNLACYQAQLGRLESARARLREAVLIDPTYLALAFVDPDLAPLRQDRPKKSGY